MIDRTNERFRRNYENLSESRKCPRTPTACGMAILINLLLSIYIYTYLYIEPSIDRLEGF